MHVRVFTLRFNPATESFEDAAVTQFLADKEVCSIRDHFFVKDDTPYLTLVVGHRPCPVSPPSPDARVSATTTFSAPSAVRSPLMIYAYS
jgi:hypothetical protein